MKKTISQISLILLVILIGFTSVFISNSYAASLAGVNCVNSINVGESFSVSLIYPSGYNITAAQANVTVTYSDGTKSTGKIVYLVDDLVTTNSPATFKASVAGTATVSITDIYMYKTDGTAIEEGGSKSQSLTVVGSSSSGSSGSGSGSSSGSSDSNGSSNSGSNTGSSGGSEGTSNGSSSSGGSSSNSGNSGSSSSSNTTVTFTDVNEAVYTTKSCNIRKGYSTDSEKITTLDVNTELKRTGVGNNGWSRVEYKGATAYVYTEYLTTTKPNEKIEEEVSFKETNENLYAKQNCNLRASWSTDSEKVGYLEKGEAVVRTGYASNGWSRLSYNGQTVYVASRLLVVEKPEDDKEIENEVDEETGIEDVVEDPTQMSEEDRLKELQNEIGVLPEVGNNIAIYIYLIVTMFAIIGSCVGIIYIKKTK